MKSLLKLLLCWAAFGVSLVGGGMLTFLLHLRLNVPTDNTSPAMHTLAIGVAGALLVLGLYPMARGLAGSGAARAGGLVTFLFLALGVNTLLDAAIYSSLLDGTYPANTLMFLVQALLVGGSLGLCFGQAGQPAGFPVRSWLGWTGRGVIAWLAFPLIYLGFGMCVAPIVVPYYQNGVLPGFHIPPMSTIIATQLLRSLIFLASSLPLIALWKGSRRGLWLTLGLAHAVAVGIYGLTAATFMPTVMRVTHGVEITFDSFAYAGVLVLLFTAPALSRTAPSPALKDAQLRAM